MIDFNDLCIGLGISEFLICAANLIFAVVDRRSWKLQNKVYLCILGLLLADSACGIFASAAEQLKMGSDAAFGVLQTARYIYFLTHALLAPAFFFYISHVVGRAFNWDIKWLRHKSLRNFLFDLLPKLAVVGTEIIIALNPLLHWVWYFDEARDFHRAWGEFLLVYVHSGLWMAASFVLLMRAWNVLSKNRKYAICFCYSLVLIGVLTQLFFRHIRIEILMQAIGFTGVLLFVENEDDQKDVMLDVYNAPAFVLDTEAALGNKMTFYTIILRGIRVEQTAGTSDLDWNVYGKAVADYLSTKIERHCIYEIAHETYALLVYHRSEEETVQLAEEIAERFTQPWNIDGTELKLTAAVMVIDLPTRAGSVSDILYIAECPIPESAAGSVMKGNDLNWIVRQAAVEAAVSRGLREGSFEVYYQPTYHTDKQIYGAEALVRMHDKELGNIYPDEFIPVAEQMGLIDEIDRFVLEEVCRLLKTGIPQQYGVGHINVNLSVIECMKEGFAEQIIGTVRAAGVPCSCISFEITESAAAADYAYLAKVIEKLKEAGFTFYIDDFGTGYSNISALFSLGADIIKIDKSLLWGAEKSELGMVLLRGTIKMVQEMHLRTLTEGVETETQRQTLAELGCNYLQGYYFSKPLPKDDFLAHIRGNAVPAKA